MLLYPDPFGPSVLTWEADLGVQSLQALHSTSTGYHWGHCSASQEMPSCSHRITAKYRGVGISHMPPSPESSLKVLLRGLVSPVETSSHSQEANSMLHLTSFPGCTLLHIKCLHLTFVSNAALSLLFFFFSLQIFLSESTLFGGLWTGFHLF